MRDLSVDTLQGGYTQKSSLFSGHYSGYIFKPIEYTASRTFFADFAQHLSATHQINQKLQIILLIL